MTLIKRRRTIKRDNITYEKVGKNEPISIEDELPFEIPESWEWVRLGSVSSYGEAKKNISIANAAPYMWCLELADIEKGGKIIKYKTVSEQKAVGVRTVFKKGDILYSKLRPYLLKIVIASSDGICTSELVPFSLYGKILPDYIVNYLKSPYVDNLINSITYGVKMPRVGTETMTSLLIPLPPLNEQNRIVAKLEELLTLVEQYGEKQEVLDKLDTNLPTQLKKSILQEAIQGKLVPQNPSDEPASILLERIRAEKQKLIKEGKIKKDKNESIIYRRDNSHYEKRGSKENCIDEYLPYELPKNWQWERWGNISESIQYGYNAPAKNEGIIKMVRISDIQNNEVLWDTVPFCDIEEDNIKNYLLQPGDILFARTGGTVGKSYLVRNVPERAIYAGYLIRTRYSKLLLSEYLKYFMESELYWSQLRSGTIATAQPNCNGKTLGSMFIPIPPLKEQYRIVVAIKQIMTMIDSL